MPMRIINPGRLFALICLLAAWAGLDGARAPASAAPSPSTSSGCTISNATLIFGTVAVGPNYIPSQTTASGSLTVSCPSVPNAKVWVCIPRLDLLTIRGSSFLYYTIAAVNKQVSTNSGQVPIEGTTNTKQYNVLAGFYDAYNSPSVNLTYSTTGCQTAGTPFLTQPIFEATASVQKSCSVASPNNLTFGSTSSLQAQQVANTTINASCNYINPFGVALSAGNSNATDPTQRKMSDGKGNTITYGLYQDVFCSVPWGWSQRTTPPVPEVPTSPALTVYGCVPKQPTPPAGNYSDTIVLTVTY
jgi:spore coat protein U-like protein